MRSRSCYGSRRYRTWNCAAGVSTMMRPSNSGQGAPSYFPSWAHTSNLEAKRRRFIWNGSYHMLLDRSRAASCATVSRLRTPREARLPPRFRHHAQLIAFVSAFTVLVLAPTWAQASLNQHGLALTGTANIECVAGPSHGRPERSEDGRKGGAGRAQAEGRARNGVGIKNLTKKTGPPGT
jgi:hypothetical protein